MQDFLIRVSPSGQFTLVLIEPGFVVEREARAPSTNTY